MMETMFYFRPFTCLTTIQGASEAMTRASQVTKARSFSQAQVAQLRTPLMTTLFTPEEF